MANKWVYLFSEGNANMRELLGGKGANLAEMTSLGLPVPQGFTITTEACTQYYEDGREINEEIQGQINTRGTFSGRTKIAGCHAAFSFFSVPVFPVDGTGLSVFQPENIL